jgi:hypothetical protein
MKFVFFELFHIIDLLQALFLPVSSDEILLPRPRRVGGFSLLFLSNLDGWNEDWNVGNVRKTLLRCW